MASHGETPAGAQVPAEWQDKIINAHLMVGDAGADGRRLRRRNTAQGQQGFSVSIQVDDEGEAKRIFDALADGGTVTLPFAPTFWAKGFGMLKDRFGTPWMVGSAKAG